MGIFRLENLHVLVILQSYVISVILLNAYLLTCNETILELFSSLINCSETLSLSCIILEKSKFMTVLNSNTNLNVTK